ncbi:uncharacterized protein LOC143845692 [Tasmannia lanceolata]|uniref:uncharacterized protein LOC143845692 n=1 Tax=Tasmannia lanceolata TaxID=3420 RepID=UPI0040628866
MEQEPKWEFKAIAKVKESSADQVWGLLQDFFSLAKWFPGIPVCRKVEGVSDIVRYCETALDPTSGGDTVRWANEKLISFDPIGRAYSYGLEENNTGIEPGSYLGMMKVVSDSDHGSEIMWNVVMDPAEGWDQVAFLSFLEFNLQAMAKRMEEVIHGSH